MEHLTPVTRDPAALRASYDVVVVGAGAAGCLASKELSEGGLCVLTLDAGPAVDPERDFPLPAPAPGGPVTRALGALRGQPVQARCMLWGARTRHLFVDDRQNPYGTPRGSPFLWFRGRRVGGRLHTWARVVLRMSDLELAAASSDGAGEDWPIDSADLAPHYARVERFLGVDGDADGLATIPDSELAGRWPPTAGEREFRERVAAAHPDRPVASVRVLRHDPGRVPAGLRAGLATGRLTVAPETIAERVVLAPGGRRAEGVAVLDARSGARATVRARAVVLCASTIESVRLLLLSAGPGHAAGLGNGSGLLGRCLMDHCMVYAAGPAERDPAFDAEPADPYDHGRIHGFYLPRFRNLGRRDAGFLRGYGILGGIGRGRPAWSLVAFGEVLARPENRITLDPERRDAWGIPAARIEYRHGPNERAMVADMHRTLAELAQSGGLCPGAPGGGSLGRVALWLARRRLFTADGALLPGSSNHEVGGARMGRDPATSVLDPWNRLWEVPNVLVTDGAAFVSSGYQNVTLTILALTARACARLVEELRSGR